MWELDHKKRQSTKELMLLNCGEIPLDFKEIKPVNLKENQPWVFIGSTDAEAEASVLWLPDGKSWFIRKDRDAGKGRRRKGWRGMRWLDGITDSLDMSLSQSQEIETDREVRRAAVHGVAKSRTRLSNCLFITENQPQKLSQPCALTMTKYHKKYFFKWTLLT